MRLQGKYQHSIKRRRRTFPAASDKRKENKQQQQTEEIEHWQPFYLTHGNTQETIEKSNSTSIFTHKFRRDLC